MRLLAFATLAIAFNTACLRLETETSNVTTAPPVTPAPVAQPAPEVKMRSRKEVACDAMKNIYKTENAHYIAPVTNTKIERHYQRVVRKRCDGSVISDGIETVKNPHQDVQLRIPVPTRFYSAFVFNQTTCDHKLSAMPAKNSALIGWLLQLNVQGDGEKVVVLKGDVANALLTFELAPGLNQIYVDFHMDCAPSSVPGNVNVVVGQSTCESSARYLRALYPVHVDYREETLPGYLEKVTGEPGICAESSEQKN